MRARLDSVTVSIVIAVTGALALPGCASGRFTSADAASLAAPLGPFPPAELDHTLLLVGDAGDPILEHPGEPVLLALAHEASRAPSNTTVVFLGDLLYPEGLADDASARDRARVAAQMSAVPPAARGILLPGNHDHRGDLWNGGRSERALAEAIGAANIEVLPTGNCPGPVIRQAGSRLQLVLLDSEWFLEEDVVRDAKCPTATRERVAAELRRVMSAPPGVRTVVAMHHPPRSHGVHGGHFTPRHHLFPLTELSGAAYVPLPVLGSLYPLLRGAGIFSPQDHEHPRHRAFANLVYDAVATTPPLAIVGGHEHVLEVLRSPVAGVEIVSGAGSVSRPEVVGRSEDTLFASDSAGFARIDALTDGRVRLQMFEVSPDGVVRIALSIWIAD